MKKLFLNMESVADDFSIVTDDLFGTYSETSKKKIIKEKYYTQLKKQADIIEDAVKKLLDLQFQMENESEE